MLARAVSSDENIEEYPGNMKNKMNFNNTPIDWNEVHSVIDNSEKLLLTTHENPDGDGLGAECGLYYHLAEQKKKLEL